MAKPPEKIHHSISTLLLCVYTILISSSIVQCTKPHKPLLQSDVIEDVDATRLFRMIEEEDYLAVFFCEYQLSLFCLTACHCRMEIQFHNLCVCVATCFLVLFVI